jgi:hypothetical protein
MAYIPPVNIPSLGGKNYARDLYGMISGVGQAYYGAKRDTVADEQWQAEQERLNTAQALAQSNADRNYALELQKFEADQASGSSGPKYYGSAQWYNRGDGSMGFGVLGTDGTFKDIPAPDGAQWAPPVTFQDTGTARVPMYTRGGGQAGDPLQVDNSGKAYDTEFGKAAGGVAASLPTAISTGERVIGEIDALLAPGSGLESVTGTIGGMMPTTLQSIGTDGKAAEVQSRIDLVLGGTFMQAYESLKGAGQITEVEGQKAMEALNRLRTQTMTDAAYRQALFDFRTEVQKLMEIARQRAQRPGGTSPGGLQVFEE